MEEWGAKTSHLKASTRYPQTHGYHNLLQHINLTPEEAYISYMLYLQPRILYPLPVSYLTEKQCRTVQAPALSLLLPKLHLNHHAPRAILFAGPKYGGLSLPELYTYQSYGQ